MSKTLAQVLGAENLCGMIQGVVGGVPEQILPPSFLASSQTITGSVGTYTRVDSNRKTARLVHYGAPSVKADLQGVSEVPVNLIHTFEHQVHPAATYVNLRSEAGSGRQRLGAETVARQVGEFGRRFRNLRASAVYSILAQGLVYFDGNGNLLPTSAGAVVSVDYHVPAGNQSTCNMLGAGAIFSGNWDTAATDISGQIEAMKVAALKLTGYPLRYAFYGTSVPGYLLTNTNISNLIRAVPNLAQNYAGNTIPDGLLGLIWRPAAEAFFVDPADSYQTWWDHASITFTPEPSPDWWDMLQGTFPVPRALNISGDASAALGDLEEVAGAFSYAEVTTDPPGIKHYAGDTFLPVLKVPAAIVQVACPHA